MKSAHFLLAAVLVTAYSAGSEGQGYPAKPVQIG